MTNRHPPSVRPLAGHDPKGPTPPDAVHRVAVGRYVHGVGESGADLVAVERPLCIRIGGETLAMTMRTPGHDRELVAGFLLAEGWITEREDLAHVTLGAAAGTSTAEDTVDVTLKDTARTVSAPRRGTIMTSACGVCGRSTLDDLMERCHPINDTTRWDPGVVARLTHLLGERQPLFTSTGGLHAAGLVACGTEDLVAYEDVGRHNAVDKVVGDALLTGRLPLSRHALVVSGRTSFEIVQKAISAGIPLVASVSAPSSLAIEMAERAGLTLIGFCRGEQFNVYAGGERLQPG